MDSKTPEINPTPEPIKVPENWKIPEIKESKIIQFDLANRFIAVQSYKTPQYAEYFLDKSGELKYFRYTRDLRPTSGAVLNQTTVCLREETEYYFVGSDTAYGANSYISVSFVRPAWGKENILHNELAEVSFSKGQLRTLGLPDLYSVDDQGNRIESHDIIIGLKKGAIGENEKDWHVEGEDWLHLKGLKPISLGQPNELGIKDRNDQLVYKVTWKIEDGHFILDQEKLREGIHKTLRSPLQIDMEKVNQAVLSNPPYPKRKRDRGEILDVPWRKIDRVVGASPSYIRYVR